jgi:hypothetical protein
MTTESGHMTNRRINICVVVATGLLLLVLASLVPVTLQPDVAVDIYPQGIEAPPDRVMMFCDYMFARAVKTEGHGWLICSDATWICASFAEPGSRPTVTVVEKGLWIFKTRVVR